MGGQILTQEQAHAVLDRLLSAKTENEMFERKEMKRASKGKELIDELGKYFSALSNEATLRGGDDAWILLGVDDNGIVVGTQALGSHEAIMELKKEIADQTPHRHTFAEIYDLERDGKRVLLFQVPPAPGVVVTYKGFAYGRDGSSLVALSLNKIDRIRVAESDWSAGLIDRTLSDIDPKALAYAREKYAEKNPRLAAEARSWSDEEFLGRLNLISRDGRITRAAALLLGTPNASFPISAMTEIKWILKDKNGNLIDFERFLTPFILTSNYAVDKIANYTYRRLMNGFTPEEMLTYDPMALREAVNNQIAHSDYRSGAEIYITEIQNDRIIFTNPGSFLPPSVEAAVLSTMPSHVVRNPLLAKTMVSLGLVDSVGTGMRKMFLAQAERYFPLPEYHVDDRSVNMTIIGHPINEPFRWAMYRNPGLPLRDVMILDKVQKGIPISEEEADRVRPLGVIERSGGGYILTMGGGRAAH